LPANILQERRRLKRYVFAERTVDGVCMCELCGKRPATDLHEIINRAHVHSAHRQMLYVRELVSALCNTCNTTVADTKRSRQRLMDKNRQRYGDAVDKAIAALEKQTKGGICVGV
jgi:hypothetical protein